MYRLLKSKSRGLDPAVTRFTQQLVRTPSVSLQEGRVADHVEEQMHRLDYDTVVRDATGNVAGVIYGREAEPVVLLCTHLDTVPAGEAEAWEHGPYSGHVAGGRMYGRGAADCKAGVAAQLFSGALLKRSLLPLQGTLVVAATVAEENGLGLGVRPLLSETLPELGLQPDFAILGEPTELGLYYGHDGWLETDIEIKGANPVQVENAASTIYRDLERIRESRSRLSHGREDIAVYAPRFGAAEGDAPRATVRMDRRLQGVENVEAVLHEVNDTAARLTRAAECVAVKADVRVQRQRLYTGQTTVVRRVTNAWQTDPFDPFIERARRALRAAGCSATPGKWKLNRLGMGTAGGTLVNEFNIPTIGYGPGCETAAHAVNEHVELDKVTACVYGTAACVHGLIGVPVLGWSSDEP